MSSMPNTHFPFLSCSHLGSWHPSSQYQHQRRARGTICEWKWYWWPSCGLSEDHAQKASIVLIDRGCWRRGQCVQSVPPDESGSQAMEQPGDDFLNLALCPPVVWAQKQPEAPSFPTSSPYKLPKSQSSTWPEGVCDSDDTLQVSEDDRVSWNVPQDRKLVKDPTFKSEKQKGGWCVPQGRAFAGNWTKVIDETSFLLVSSVSKIYPRLTVVLT